MYALNIDPRNPQGDPPPSELSALGVEMVRYTFKDPTPAKAPDRQIVRFYRQQIEELADAGIQSLVILSAETYPHKPNSSAPDEEWAEYITGFAERAAEITKVLAAWRPAFQVWDAPDLASASAGYDPALREPVFARLLKETYEAIKRVDSGLRVVAGGLVSGQPSWLRRVADIFKGRLPADVVAIHPFSKRPTPDWPAPDWGSGYVGDLIEAYRQVTKLPLWITAVGEATLDEEGQAEYLRRFYQTMTTQFVGKVEQVFWFCYADGMAHPFGLIDHIGQPKPAYRAYAQAAKSTIKAAGLGAKATVSLDRLHEFARYLEQSIVFGERNQNTQRQMEIELRGNFQSLSKVDIWRLTQHMLAGSNFGIAQPELDGLYALQGSKDLYGVLRSIVIATHQRTGALSGRIGVHVRISAEADANAATNTEAVMQILSHIQPGQRMIVMDTVKAIADENKLLAPDVFETDVYGQHRNGLVDNHAWNLQRLIRAIRDRGYQDRVILIIRLDGPDNGANVNPFSASSLRKYRLAIAKVIRYLETMLPTVPFKLVLGNEPDLPTERGWSDLNADPRTFTINQFAPATGNFMKEAARGRPDVTFICPALSANLKHDQLAYYTAFFGQERPENLVPALHGYAADVAAQLGSQKNLLEQLTDALRIQGGFKRISGTEIGSGNPFGNCENLSDKARFDDTVAWLLLSSQHRAPPGQDNHWNYQVNPQINDPAAQYLADFINRSKNRVLRNIRERAGAGLQILQSQPEDRPAYAVEYVSHNTPTRMVAGQINAVQMTLKNTSFRSWSEAGANPVRVGYHWYTAEGTEVAASLWEDKRTNLPHDLLPGQSVTLNCELAAPRTPGSYEVRWDMVEEMRTWFGWQGVPTLNVQVTVNQEVAPDPPPSAGLRVSASHNNQQQGADNLQQAIDGNPFTRWSSHTPQQPGMWVQIDLGKVQTVSHVRLDTDRSPQDYPRGYVVKVSSDGQNWIAVAENRNNDRPLNVTFSPRNIRYIRIEQTGSDPIFWWSIHDIDISGEVKLSASASHNNVLAGGDNISQALDGQPETRWSTRAVQQPGMWFEIDLNQIRTVSGLTLDSARSPQDYPRGYVVRLSTDRSRWEEVARNDQNDKQLDVDFSPRPARYLRVEQTGRADQWWWSIHEVVVKSSGVVPLTPKASASHNNVPTGADNISQAIDGQAETRWSTRVVQQPGMWFELDLQQTRTIRGVALDTAGSPFDFPYSYIVRVSTDYNQWQEVARKDQNEGALDIDFSLRPVRYIRIEQTGSSDRWWWSIHRVEIKE